MSNKKLVLLALISAASILLGGILGTMDFFGILSQAASFNISLFLMATVLVYFITVFVFLLDYSDKKDLNKAYFLISFFFGLTYFFATKNVITTTVAAMIYYWFLHFTYKRSLARQDMYVKFLPGEIFLPVLQKSFLYLIILFSITTFVQAQKRIQTNSFITPQIVGTVTKPLAFGLNQQLTSQIDAQLRGQTLPRGTSKKEVVQIILKQTIEEMKKSGQDFMGISAQDIHIEKASVTDDGKIDMSPVIDDLKPQIASLLNFEINKYSYLVPFALTIIIFFLLKPVFSVFGYVEAVITLILFKVFIKSGFIQIKKMQAEVERVSI